MIGSGGDPFLASRTRPVPVLFLDLDGTVREGKDDALGRFVNGPQDVRVFPEACAMMVRWRERGGRIIGVSNQGGIALGHVSWDDARVAMGETQNQCGWLFDGILFCPHHPDASTPERSRCWCRKPSPGLVIQGYTFLLSTYGEEEHYPTQLGLMVGDREEDAECARLAGLDFQWASDWRRQAVS